MDQLKWGECIDKVHAEIVDIGIIFKIERVVVSNDDNSQADFSHVEKGLN